MPKATWRSRMTKAEAKLLKQYDRQIALQENAIEVHPKDVDLQTTLALLKYRRFALQSKVTARFKEHNAMREEAKVAKLEARKSKKRNGRWRTLAEMPPGVRRAVLAAGGRAVYLARLLNITPQAICQWSEIPVLRLREIERITKIDRKLLRPDLYRRSKTIEEEQLTA